MAGLVAAAYLVALFAVRRVPDALLAALGGPSGIARDGGLAVRYRPPAGVSTAQLEAGLVRRGGVVRHEADWLIIELLGVAEDDARDVSAMLASGGLEFREVLDDMSLMKRAERGDDRIDRIAGVRVELDTWTPESGSERRTSSYLLADRPAELDAAFDELTASGWRPPPHSTIVYQRVAPSSWLKVDHMMWRSYFVSDRAEVDGNAVVSAIATTDPYTDAPRVLVEFDRDGAQRFGELTERIVGRKLAMLVGGVVKSAPVINEPIRGGRALITPGAGTLDRQAHEAAAIAAVLKIGALPAGGAVEGDRWIPPASPGNLLWLARLVIGAAGGVLVGLVFGLLVRVARPAWYRPRRPAGRLPIRRFLVTLLAPAAMFGLAQIELPGVDVAELYHVLVHAGHGAPPVQLTVIALGLGPILTAFIAVELATMLVPRWRRIRLRPRARIAIGRWVAIVGVAFTLVQSFLVCRFLASAAMRGGVEIGGEAYVTATLSMTAGTLLLVVVAGMIRQHGLGNGYGALLISGWLLALLERLLAGPDAGDALGAATLAVVICATVALLRMRIGDDRAAPLRLPASGVAPLTTAQGAAAMWSVVSVGLLALQGGARPWLGWSPLAVIAVFVPVWSLAFSRPAIVAAPAARSSLAAPRWADWRRAVLVSLAMLLAIAGVHQLSATSIAGAEAWCDPLTAMMFAAVALDAIDDLRARRGDLVVAWPLHQAQRAELVRAVLADAGIECHLASSHLRTLLAWFGPFAPIDVLVPAASADAARGKIGALFEDAAVEAFD